MAPNVHELAAAMSADMRLERRLKEEAGQAAESHLDVVVDQFFADRAASIMSAADYEALVAQYGGANAHAILIAIATARIQGEELTPEQAYRQLMDQAGAKAGATIDPMDHLSQKRTYSERKVGRDWRVASGDPPAKAPKRRRRRWSKKDVLDRYADWQDIQTHDHLVQEKMTKKQ